MGRSRSIRAKVFYHVVAPDGKQTITKGPGGKFPHHRGIFIGWNKINHNGKRHDLWHVKNTTQKHVSFMKQDAVQGETSVISRIDWIGTEGKAVLEETRSATVHSRRGRGICADRFPEHADRGGWGGRA